MMHFFNAQQQNTCYNLFILLASLCIGSFLNVIIYRLPILLKDTNHNNSLNLWQPRSFCCHCKTPIPWFLNIPLISYLLLKGISLCCRKPITKRFFYVELLSLLLVALLIWRYGYCAQLVCGMVLIFALIVLSFIDMATLTLPNQITLPLLWMGLLVNTFSLFTTPVQAIWGAACGYFLFQSISWLTLKIRKIDGLGQGDAKLIAALGAWFGCSSLPAMIFIASCSGCIIGTTYLITKKQKFTVHLPLGPFLALAGIAALFFGDKISPHTW